MSLQAKHRLADSLAIHGYPCLGIMDRNVEVEIADLGDRVSVCAVVRVSAYRTESTTRWLTFHADVPIGASWKLTDSGEHEVDVLTPYEAACELAVDQILAQMESLDGGPRLSRVSIEPPERRIRRRGVAA